MRAALLIAVTLAVLGSSGCPSSGGKPVAASTPTTEDEKTLYALGMALSQRLSAAAFSVSHGANDAQKTMGIIVGLLVATQGLFAGVVLNPLVGQLKGDDVDAETRAQIMDLKAASTNPPETIDPKTVMGDRLVKRGGHGGSDGNLLLSLLAIREVARLIAKRFVYLL